MIRSRSKLLIYGLLVVGPIGLLLSGCGEEQVTEAPAVARPVKTVVVGGAAAGGVKEYPGRVPVYHLATTEGGRPLTRHDGCGRRYLPHLLPAASIRKRLRRLF